ncbi:MAG: hypothetical protein A2V70_01280 [Planctomycetes bacterium RBG_13_63_9]|nr:MAG: hypothetical protein A2V70_01280 [Planctomycetes bacterium RBG_13_63_9]
MGAAKVLIPVGLLLGVGAGVGLAIWKTKKASASPLEEAPKTPTSGTTVTESMLADEYARAMDPATQDLDYLKKSADFLRANGKTDWAGNVSSKIASIQAGKGAAIAAAQADVAAQAAAIPTDVAAFKQQWEATTPAPSQDDVDKMYDWAMKPDTVDPAWVQMAYQTVLAYDQSSAKTARVAVLGDKLTKLKSGTYGVAAQPTSPLQPAAPAPQVVVHTPEGETVETPVPTPQQVAAEAEPKEGTPLPPLPPEPSPLPPAQQPPTTKQVPELAKEETSEAADPNGTIAVARAMIDVESRPGWKADLQPLIQNWQKKVGLTADGKFGPGSALKMGEEVGVLPLIRYYPKGSPTKESAVRAYQTKLYTLADKLTSQGKREHALAIRASAEHEKGQSWPKTPGPVLTPMGEPARVEMLDKLLTALASGGEAG